MEREGLERSPEVSGGELKFRMWMTSGVDGFLVSIPNYVTPACPLVSENGRSMLALSPHLTRSSQGYFRDDKVIKKKIRFNHTA